MMLERFGLAASAAFVLGAAPLSAQVGTDFRVFTIDGEAASLGAIVERAVGEDVLLVGEQHGDLVGHRIEATLFESLAEAVGSGSGSNRPLVLSLEMFERDVQVVVDEYLADLVTEDHFLRSSRPWTDYEIRYRPLIETAKELGSPVVAANAPRRYVNRVSRMGAEALGDLSPEALRDLPPLPYPSASRAYRAQWDSLMASFTQEGMEHDDEAGERRLQAQALWDASMGHAITEALVRHLGALVVHYAGSFHVEKGTGIAERIADYRPGTAVTTVVMTPVEDIEAWVPDEHGGLADFVILTQQAASDGGSN